jgi:plastocyanin
VTNVTRARLATRVLACGAVLAALAGACASKTSGSGTGSTSPAATSSVDAKDFEFGPAAIVVKAGTTVTWKFVGSVPHTVTSAPSDAVTFDSGNRTTGTFTVTFSKAGTYRYYCKLHGTPSGQGMAGTVTVTS